MKKGLLSTPVTTLESAKKKKSYCQSSADCEWVSVVKVVLATGKTRKLVIILRGKALYTT
jgi:hypothetical protein